MSYLFCLLILSMISITPIVSVATVPPDPPISFDPGNFSEKLRSLDNLILLSNGLAAKRIALAGNFVNFTAGGLSGIRFHINPDGAATFSKPLGGWYYVSNSETGTVGTTWNSSGVGAIEFDNQGNVIGYQRIASSLKWTCSGGRTPWNSWMSCEEFNGGKVWQVDPTGVKPQKVSAMGTLGFYESFAFDIGKAIPTFYVTRDSSDGVLTRFTPDAAGMACYRKTIDSDRWCTLDSGTRDYLVLSGGANGTFSWTTNLKTAAANAKKYYLNNEGIDVVNGTLFFVSKALKRLIILDLRGKTYTYSSTKNGAFNDQPDQLARLLTNDTNSLLYFCEDGDSFPGVHARNSSGSFFTIVSGLFNGTISNGVPVTLTYEETTGLAFSPDGKHMYVSYQHFGAIYDITRQDGRAFNQQVLDIKYH